MSIAKRWCFTINNPTPEDYFFWVDGDQDHVSDVMTNFEYFIVQEEEGEQGTRHLQGFFILKDKKRMEWIKRRCSQRMHLEVARGTNQQAADYCRKDDTYTGGLRWEMGSLPARAEVKKRDERLQDAAEQLDILKEGYKRPSEIPSMTLLQCGFIPAMKELTADVLGPWRPELKIITMVGPPATGKSYAIQKWFPGHGRCICGNNGVWFQQPLADVMVFEEFCGQIQLQRMLQYLDPYPLALEVKGSMRPALYTLAIITSNTRPDGWYKGEESGEPGKRTDAIKALWDRIGFQSGAFIPARTCGHYLECPIGISVEAARDWFDQQIARIVGTPEPVTDSD
nr:MAG: replication associated protein [ssDNA virus sp.]